VRRDAGPARAAKLTLACVTNHAGWSVARIAFLSRLFHSPHPGRAFPIVNI
jgi:hypothetical protein